MNITKAQKIIFNALLSGNHVRRFEFDKDNVFITPDGYRGFVLPYSTLQVNIEKIQVFKNMDLASIVKDENLLQLTREILIQEHPKAYLRKLKNEERNVFLDQKYLECFQNPKFYQEDKNRMVVLTEDISAIRKNVIVGCILPVRVCEDLCK
jgi:hypothetical protein